MYGRVLDASDGQFTVCDTHVDCWGVINLFNNWISISLLLACSVASSCLVLFLCGRLGPGNLCIGSSLRLNFLNNTSLRPVRLHSWRRFFIHCPVSDLTYPCPILHLFPLSCWRRYVAWGSDEGGGTDPGGGLCGAWTHLWVIHIPVIPTFCCCFCCWQHWFSFLSEMAVTPVEVLCFWNTTIREIFYCEGDDLHTLLSIFVGLANSSNKLQV